jgi:hypothetical protein
MSKHDKYNKIQHIRYDTPMNVQYTHSQQICSSHNENHSQHKPGISRDHDFNSSTTWDEAEVGQSFSEQTAYEQPV